MHVLLMVYQLPSWSCRLTWMLALIDEGIWPFVSVLKCIHVPVSNAHKVEFYKL